MRVVLLQRPATGGSFRSKLKELDKLASFYAGSLILTPEMWLSGYPPTDLSLTTEALEFFEELSLKTECGFVVNLPFEEDSLVYNRSFFVSEGEVKGGKSKEVLFRPMGEHRIFSVPLRVERPIFDFRGFRFGLAVCYELRFPEIFRQYAELGVYGVAVCAGWGKSRTYAWLNFLQARASENQIFIFGVNSVNGDYDSGGHSGVCGPDGKVWALLGEEEGVLTCEVDTERVGFERSKFPLFEDYTSVKGRWRDFSG